jgi:hypothetical protein
MVASLVNDDDDPVRSDDSYSTGERDNSNARLLGNFNFVRRCTLLTRDDRAGITWLGFSFCVVVVGAMFALLTYFIVSHLVPNTIFGKEMCGCVGSSAMAIVVVLARDCNLCVWW